MSHWLFHFPFILTIILFHCLYFFFTSFSSIFLFFHFSYSSIFSFLSTPFLSLFSSILCIFIHSMYSTGHWLFRFRWITFLTIRWWWVTKLQNKNKPRWQSCHGDNLAMEENGHRGLITKSIFWCLSCSDWIHGYKDRHRRTSRPWLGSWSIFPTFFPLVDRSGSSWIGRGDNKQRNSHLNRNREIRGCDLFVWLLAHRSVFASCQLQTSRSHSHRLERLSLDHFQLFYKLVQNDSLFDTFAPSNLASCRNCNLMTMMMSSLSTAWKSYLIEKMVLRERIQSLPWL